MTTSPYEKDFDTILNDVLTDYDNLDDSPDVSIGSMAFVNGSTLSSMLWGLYKYQGWIHKQHFPDTADSTNLKRWGAILEVTYTGTDTDATYLIKVLNKLRQPPAGGNALDFENWAKDSDNSYVTYGGTTYTNEYATVVSTPNDLLGTVGVYTIPDDETIINQVKASGNNTSVVVNKLVDSGADFVTAAVAAGDPVTNTTDDSITTVASVEDLNTLVLNDDIFTGTPEGYSVAGAEELLRRATETYIETVRPLGMISVTVSSSDPATQAVTIEVTAPVGGSVDTTAIEDAIENLLDTYKPGQTLHKSILTCTALSYGAATAVVSVPAAEETTVDNDEHIRPGTINVTEA
ncbi:MAG: baseplate J/gp47 family protein [Candidatus Omnitrophica bacterium]|nr:baseplate J/gp47 family protein [Candidatus Omnitrophota bacterium]